MLSVANKPKMLSVIMLNVVILSVVAPFFITHYFATFEALVGSNCIWNNLAYIVFESRETNTLAYQQNDRDWLFLNAIEKLGLLKMKKKS